VWHCSQIGSPQRQAKLSTLTVVITLSARRSEPTTTCAGLIG
jgi:hypothetical protein